MAWTKGRSQTNQAVRHTTGNMSLMGFGDEGERQQKRDVYRTYDRLSLGVS